MVLLNSQNINPGSMAIIFGIIIIVFHLFIEYALHEDKKSKYKIWLNVFFIAGLSYWCHLTLESNYKLHSIENELVNVNEKATAFEFFKPYETIEKLEDKPTFQALLKNQMESTRDRLYQIEKGELRLSREEVIPIWEDMISKYASKEIKATNLVSISDWEKFSPNQGMEAHEEFLQKSNTKFQRLFIYDSQDTLSIKGTKELFQKQMALAKKKGWGNKFQIKLIAKNKIDNNTYGNTMYSNFGTLDIVVFDNECVLQTITQHKNNADEIVNAVITNNKTKLDVANSIFDKLWSKAETFADIEKLKTR